MAGSLLMALRRTFAAVALFLSVAVVPATASAATATLRPVIVSLTVSGPRPLPAAGAQVVVTVRVHYATTCTFMRQFSAFSSLYVFKTVSCASGRATVVVPAIANSNKAPRRLTYTVRVRGAGTASVQRSVTVAQAAAASLPSPSPTPTPSPPSTSPTATLSVSPGNVPSTGGTVVLTFTSSNATACTLASAPTFWTTGANPATVDCTGTYTATLNSTTTQQQWTFTFTATNAFGQSASATQTLTELAPAPPPTPTISATSTNWSGYIVPSSSALITDASGQWTVPTLNCSATPNGEVAAWVGIGGVSWPTGGTSGTLLQTGITSKCVNGFQQNAGVFEEYPSIPNTDKAFIGFPVSPGDSIEASVFQGGTGAWETKVDDLSTCLSGVMVTGSGWGVSADSGNGLFLKQGSTVGLSYSGGYTVEWIVEDPANADGSPMPFANYGTVTFTSLRTSLSPWYLTADEGIAIAQGGVVLSTPSAPANGGFTVSYTG